MKRRKKAEVISIFGGPAPQAGEVNKALERAKAGYTIGIALVEVLNPKMDATQWCVAGCMTRWR